MTDVSAAVHPHAGGVALDVEVTPGASDERFPAGYNVWRKRIEVRVRAKPTEGEANAAVIDLVAGFFEVPSRHVALLQGATSRQKRIAVNGIDAAAALQKLAAAMSRPRP